MRAKRVQQNGLDFRENLHIVVSQHAQAAAPKPGFSTGIG
jgi:hypothetical protein